MATVSKADRGILSTAATNLAANAATYASEKAADRLVKAGMVEKHPTEKNANGEPLIRITDAGKALVEKFAALTPRATPAVPDGGFAIVTGFTMPEPKRLAARTAVYPFEQLEIGQGFFIPVSDDNKEPWKRMTSTVSSANKRYSDSTPRRFFRVAEVEHEGVKGAMVQRMEPPAPKPAA